MEVRLRNLRQETQKFNQDWWTDHNREFKQGRESFIKNILETKYPNEPDKSTLSADEMSQFYRLEKTILHPQNDINKKKLRSKTFRIFISLLTPCISGSS